MNKAPSNITKTAEPVVRLEKIEITDNFVKFVELLLKVDKRLQEQKRREMLS